MDLPLVDVTWLWTSLVLILLGFFYYRYLTASYSYWEERGVPFVPAKPIVGSIPIFSRKKPEDISVELYKKYGKIFGSYEGKRPVLTVADPDLLRNILVKDFPSFSGRRDLITGNVISDNMLIITSGENWKRLRCIITPTFSTGKIKRMIDIILGSAKTLVDNFIDTAGKPVNAKRLFSSFTMDVIASVAFGTKLHSYQDPNNKFVQEVNKAFTGTIVTLRCSLIILFPGLSRLFGINLFNTKVMEFLRKITLEIIEDRKKSGTVRNDFLQLLMDSEKEIQEQENEQTPEKAEETDKENMDDKNAKELGHEENTVQFLNTSKTNKVLSHDELVAQCVLFFLAGFETVASTLTYTLYFLAINPEIQDKLRTEIDDVIISHDGKLTYDAIQEMKYLDNVLTETLRIYPPAIRLERIAEEDYKLGNTGIVVEKGTIVGVPVYAIHHDPEFYPDPEKFKPERFTTDQRAKHHPYSYLTFGAGPRNCIGMRFALMETKLCLAYMISQLTIKRCHATKIPLETSLVMGLLLPKELMLNIEKRQNTVFDGL